jgi:hypothetical protein
VTNAAKAVGTTFVLLSLACGGADGPSERPAVERASPKVTAPSSDVGGPTRPPERKRDPYACNDAGWCWENPLPVGPTLNAIFGLDAARIWAVGDKGRIQRWDGSAWKPETSGTEAPLHGVWAADATHTFAVGDGVILRGDGSSWSLDSPPAKDDWSGISGANPKAAWVVGKRGTILRWDGQAWSVERSAAEREGLLAVSSIDENNAWAVGEAGLLRRTAAGWRKERSPSKNTLLSVWASPKRVLIGDNEGAIYESAGGGFRASGAGNISDPRAIFGLWGFAAKAVSVGPGGTIRVKEKGPAWVWHESETTWELRAVWGSDPQHLWAVGKDGTIVVSDGSRWRAQNSVSRDSFSSIWGADEHNIWVAGYGGSILKRDERGWRVQRQPSAERLHAVWGSDKANVWVIGDGGQILKLEGDAWVREPSPIKADLWAISGVNANDVWAVGSDGAVLHREGGAWKVVASNTKARLTGVYCADTKNQWIVGTDGVILRGDGGVLKPEQHGTKHYFNGVWGSGTDRVWAFSSIAYEDSHAAVVMWDGRRWVDSRSELVDLRALWGSNEMNLWAVAKNVYRREGGGWKEHPQLSEWRIETGVWGTDPDHVWVVADSGAIVRYVR